MRTHVLKGALLNDPKALLHEQGEDSRSSFMLEFRSVADVASMKSALRDLVADPIRDRRVSKVVAVCGVSRVREAQSSSRLREAPLAELENVTQLGGPLS